MLTITPIKTDSWADPRLGSGNIDASGIEGERTEVEKRAEVGEDMSTEGDQGLMNTEKSSGLS